MKKAKKFLGDFPIIKFKTPELINKSFLILFFDSSAIVDAIYLKKRIICLRSKIFYGKRYNSDLYKDILNLKSVNIDGDLNKNINLIYLESQKKKINYNKYLKIYGGNNSFQPGERTIINIIKKKYF